MKIINDLFKRNYSQFIKGKGQLTVFVLLIIGLQSFGQNFEASSTCTSSGVIGCRAFDSMNNILEVNIVAVPNTPNNPLTNGKCRWNGGSSDCFPYFDGGNCSIMDSLGQRSQDTVETAKLWSPCYDASENAARLTFWNDRGSSIQKLIVIPDLNINVSQLWTQYEVKLSSEFFFNPEGTTSAKLYRIHRSKTDSCLDERFVDNRFSVINVNEVGIAPVFYCADSYAGSEAGFTLDPSRANHWIRVTAHYDIPNGAVTFWGYDVTTGELLSHKYVDSHRGSKINFPFSEVTIQDFYFTLHSTSHEPNPAQNSPHYWFRNAVLSIESISPYPGSTLSVADNDLTFDNNISIFPNPVSDSFTIDLKDEGLESLVIYNQLGQLIKEVTTNDVDISNLSNGIYFVKITSQNGKIITERIIKN